MKPVHNTTEYRMLGLYWIRGTYSWELDKQCEAKLIEWLDAGWFCEECEDRQVNIRYDDPLYPDGYIVLWRNKS